MLGRGKTCTVLRPAFDNGDVNSGAPQAKKTLGTAAASALSLYYMAFDHSWRRGPACGMRSRITVT